MHRGYIAIWRKIVDHPFAKERRVYSKYEAWIDILMQVRHSEKPEEVVIGMSVLKCNYAESLLSILSWSRRWNWSESKVRRFFKLLEKMDQITVKSEKKTTRIKVLNYSQYDPKRRKNEFEPKDDRRMTESEPSTNNNDNNVNNGIMNKKHTSELSVPTFEWKCFEGMIISKIISSIQDLDITCKVPTTDKQLNSWAVHVDRLKRLDSRTEEQIEFVVDWVSKNHFWKKNIRSTAKLREKFDQLVAAIQSEHSKPKTKHEARLEHNNQVGHDFIKEMLQEAEDEKRQR